MMVIPKPDLTGIAVPKRVVCKPGDIFAAPVPDNKTAFFQYLGRDLSDLNSDVIRAFEIQDNEKDVASYPRSLKERLNHISGLAVRWYCHCTVSQGVRDGYWYKVGKGVVNDWHNVKEIWFGNVHDRVWNEKTHEDTLVNPLENWTIWHMNGNRLNIGRLPRNLENKVYEGTIYPAFSIYAMLWLGCLPGWSTRYFSQNRIPHPQIHLYLKKPRGSEEVFYHFRGNELIERFVVPLRGNGSGLWALMPDISLKFSDLDWDWDDFITEGEFRQAMKNPKVIKLGQENIL